MSLGYTWLLLVWFDLLVVAAGGGESIVVCWSAIIVVRCGYFRDVSEVSAHVTLRPA
jgi:hypothetical protein